MAAHAKRILLAAFGSLGDLYPILAIARELRARHHEVGIATGEEHRASVEAAGLRIHPVRPSWHPKHLNALGLFPRLRGSFEDLMNAVPVERIAVLRLDGDMYESTIVALRSLYGNISLGGYLIVDDYSAIPACRQAVNDFRRERWIREIVHPIDWTGIFWQIV